MKRIQKNILSYILLVSPILVSSFFIYKSNYPVWANTLLLAMIISLIVAIINYKNIIKKQEVNILSLASISLGLAAAVIFATTSKLALSFAVFGKGVTEWTAMSILSLFVVFAYFVASKRYQFITLVVSSAAIFYTTLNFLLVKYLPSVANYTGYINIPMISFGKIFNYAFVYSAVVLAASLIAYVLDKKGYTLTSITKVKYIKYVYMLVAALLALNILSYGLRYVAAHYYIKAVELAYAGDLAASKTNINRAISIAPFDVYYLDRIELINADIRTLLSSTSTDKAVLEKNYKDLVEYQISDAKKAVAYDNKNPRNYMALGLAYERAMLLTKEDGYKMAVEAYEKARDLADDKDYVDVVKAKLSFSADKEQEALTSLDRALRFNASSAPALYVSSQYYSLKNNTKLAIDYGEKAVLVAPNAADARMNLGLLYLKNNNIDAAIQLFGSAFTLSNQQDNTALYYLGVAYKVKSDAKNLKLVVEELEKRLGTGIKEIQDLKTGL